jgi:hypothetical protein
VWQAIQGANVQGNDALDALALTVPVS